MNKARFPIFALKWMPDGRRIVNSSSSGEFSVFNGANFQFENVVQAHEQPSRTLSWTHNGEWLISGDDSGHVKYWQSNMNSIVDFTAHPNTIIRELCIAPTDAKIATGGDDAVIRVFDFHTTREERILRGHGNDVRTVAWHPFKGLLASGSKDTQQPVMLWDPRREGSLCTLTTHKNTVTSVRWNKNGNHLLTCARDHLIKLFDIRKMKMLQEFRGHKNEVESIAWHPIHESLFVSGGADGSLFYWMTGYDKEIDMIEQAHAATETSTPSIWCLDWHPLGHILASGSNDRFTKFWTRPRPGHTRLDRSVDQEQFEEETDGDFPDAMEADVAVTSRAKVAAPMFVTDKSVIPGLE